MSSPVNEGSSTHFEGHCESGFSSPFLCSRYSWVGHYKGPGSHVTTKKLLYWMIGVEEERRDSKQGLEKRTWDLKFNLLSGDVRCPSLGGHLVSHVFHP